MQLLIADHRGGIGRLNAQIQQRRMGDQGHQQLQGQQPAQQDHQPAPQPAPPWPPRPGAGAGDQGRIRQRGCHHRPNPGRKENSTAEHHQAPQRMAHQHRRRLDHLLQKGLQLAGPKAIVQP